MLVTALPLTLLLAVAIWDMAVESADAQRTSMLYTARALAAAVDANIDKHATLGRTLATAPSLLDDDLGTFEADARRALGGVKDTWVLVANLDGEQLLNLVPPHRGPLSKRPAAALAAQHKAQERNEVVVSDVFRDPVTDRLFAAIDIPIRKDGKPFRELAIPMPAEGFQDLVKAQSVRDGWRASIADTQGRIVARLPQSARYIGNLVNETHRPFIGQTGVFEWTSLDGEPLIAAGVRTASGWTASVGVTRSTLFAEVWNDVRWVSLAACAVIFASLLVARRIAGGIDRPIRALAAIDTLETDEEAKRCVASLPEAAAVAKQIAQTRDQLTRSEARLRLALDAAEAGTWEANIKNGTFVASDRALTMHGFAPGASITPDEGLSVLLPEDRQLAIELALETHRTGRPFNVEVRIKKPDGSIRWIGSRGAVREGPDGRCIVGLVQDITDRRKAEEALREHDSRLETVFESLPIGVGMFDVNGRVPLANRQMLKRLPNGLIPSHDASTQCHRWRAYHDDGTPLQLSDFPGARALRGERVVPGIEMMYVDDDGQETWLNIVSAPIRDAHDKIYAAFAAVIDITDRKRNELKLFDINRELEARVDERTRELQREMKLREDTQAQLSQAQRLDALGKLTGGIAHDFNNLLTVIIGNLELAELQPIEGEVKAFIHQAMAAAETGATINRRLLSFARRQMLVPQRLNLNDRVLEMHQLLKPSLGEKISLAIHAEPALWSTIADPGEIDSAIVNLAINARDAMPDGGALTITTRNVTFDHTTTCCDDISAGDYACISVADNGHGMSPDVLKRAMEPFFTTKEFGKGSGLGLSSVYGFLRQSGGAMTIESEVGRGTVVTMCLPRVPEERCEIAPTSGTGACRGSGELVLVVEDNDSVRDAARLNLESLGYRVVDAANAADAKRIIASTADIKLVFSDVVMPGGMSGYDLAEWIRAEQPGIKVLLASGHHDIALDETLRASVRLLGKPYKRAQFAQALRDLLQPETS